MKVTTGMMTETVVATEIITEAVNMTEIVIGTMTTTGTVTETGIVTGTVKESMIAIVTKLLHGTETVAWAGKPVVVKISSKQKSRYRNVSVFSFTEN